MEATGTTNSIWTELARGRRGLLVCLVVVTAGTVLLALPGLVAPILTPDAMGYVATAYNWTEGRGFVDPISLSYYLRDLHPPLPAFVVRPPVLSLLLLPPLAAGADLTTLHLLHMMWAAVVAGLGVLVARHYTSAPAAAVFAVAMFFSPYWLQVSQQLLPEVTAIAILLAAILLSQRAVESYRMALLLGLVTLLGWLTRPNLGIIAPAIVLAAVVDLGPRRAFRCRPLWTYVASFAVAHQIIVMAFTSSEGVAPYAHYGVAFEFIAEKGEPLSGLLTAYEREYTGAFQFMRDNWEAVVSQIGANLQRCVSVALFKPVHHYVGWAAPLALLYGLLKRGPGSMMRRFVVFAGLGITTASLGVFAGFDAKRYMLPGAFCVWFLASLLLDDLARALGERLSRKPRFPSASRARAAIVSLVLVAACALWAVGSLGERLTRFETAWRSFRASGSWGARPPNPWSVTPRSMCSHMDSDALVASPNPWSVYFWCGNAGIWIPFDLSDREGVHRYLDEQTPGYVILYRHDRLSAFWKSPRLEKLVDIDDLALYRVRNAPPESRPWKAPPPLASRNGAWGP